VHFSEALLKRLRIFEQAVCFVAFSVMAIALMADVGARELTGSGILQASQVGVFGMIVVAFMGIGLATADGAHLRPRFADRLADSITALFYWFVAGVGIYVVLEAYEFGDVFNTVRIVIWPFQLVIVLAYFIAGVRHIIFMIWPMLRPPESWSDAEVTAADILVGDSNPSNRAGRKDIRR
jgi:TRAP-type C4-dicarboxylate transport system permease small subunit